MAVCPSELRERFGNLIGELTVVQTTVMKNKKQLGITIPLFQSHGFGNIKYAQDAGDAAESVLFPCGLLFAADTLPDSNLQKPVLAAYRKAYEEKFKTDVSSFGGYAWDALSLVVEALKAVLDSVRDVDVRPLLPRVLAPTLVLHRRLDRAVHVEAGRYVASHIHSAHFIELEGDDHWFFAGEQEPLLEAIRRFIAGLRPACHDVAAS